MREPNVSWSASGNIRDRLLAVAFGDRFGLLIFLGSLCLFGLTWRTAFLINDSYTLANGLYALEHGSIHLQTAAYGPGLETPGANFFDGKTYSRNYGVLVVGLPVLLILRGLSLVADVRVLIVAGWCLTVLATAVVAGRYFERSRSVVPFASLAVLLLFAGNLALARPLQPVPYHLLALQIVHVVGAAFVGVFTYRLLRDVNGVRHGLVGAVLVVGGTPLSFWAGVPKRHVVTAAAVMAVAFAIARSRDSDDGTLAVRALAYAVVGFLAWVHAPEALVLFLALLFVDVPSAPDNSRRSLGIVAGVFLLSLIPMLVTNFSISGDPLKVPRALRSVSATGDVSFASDVDSGGGDGSAGPWIPVPLLVALGLVESAIEPLVRLGHLLERGLATALNRPIEVYRAFVRSGYVARLAERASDTPAANLALLESAPVVGGLLATIPAASVSLRRRTGDLRAGTLAVDAFVVLVALGYGLVYVSRLPIHAQVTVRYLFPLYPLAVYGLVRLPTVGETLTEHWRTFAWTYAGSVLVGGQLLLVTLIAISPSRGEAFQFHALLSLTCATAVGVWAIAGRTEEWWGRAGAVTTALATASATLFVGFASIEYFPLGDSHALPMMRALAELVTIL